MTFINIQTFERRARNFAKKNILIELKTLHQNMIRSFLARVVGKTRVKTGRARGGWRVTIGRPALGQIRRLDPDGGVTIAANESIIQRIAAFSSVFVSNNVPYISLLDDMDNIVEDALQEVAAQFPDAV